MSGHHHVLVSLERDENGYPPFDVEEVDANPLGQGLWRLESSPAFAYGIARGDVLRAVPEDREVPQATEVVSNAGNWCARVIPRTGNSIGEVVDVLRGFGWEVRSTYYQLAVVEFDAGVDPVPLVLLLDRGALEGRWRYDLGVDPRQ